MIFEKLFSLIAAIITAVLYVVDLLFSFLPDLPAFVHDGCRWVGSELSWMLSTLGPAGATLADGFAWLTRVAIIAIPVVCVLALLHIRKTHNSIKAI